MLSQTLKLIRVGLEGDPTVTRSERVRYLAALRAGPESTKATPPPEVAPRLLRRKEAAARLGGSLRWIDRLAEQGHLRKIKLPGRKRGCGFLESDINQLLAANGQ
jgi:predicted DNA-binding transcriptional regulator AlpA